MRSEEYRYKTPAEPLRSHRGTILHPTFRALRTFLKEPFFMTLKKNKLSRRWLRMLVWSPLAMNSALEIPRRKHRGWKSRVYGYGLGFKV